MTHDQEYQNAIASLITATKARVLAARERDDARAALAKVDALLTEWDLDGLPVWPTAEIRAALESTPPTTEPKGKP